jgi:type I restriction enzyme S subunit
VLAPEEGAFKRGPFGSALTKTMFVSHGYKVYEQYCPINDDCSFARYYITPEKFEEMKGFAVKAGDFLISCSGVTLGRITRVPPEFEPGVINQALLRVRINEDVLDPNFFTLLFRSPRFQQFIFDRSAGAAIPNVRGVGDLKKIPVPVPPLVEQRAIVAEVERRLSIVRSSEAQVDANLKRAQALRQAVLAKAFGGGGPDR